jgi:hypothetical protein
MNLFGLLVCSLSRHVPRRNGRALAIRAVGRKAPLFKCYRCGLWVKGPRHVFLRNW